VYSSTGWNGVLGFKAVMWDALFMFLIACRGLLLGLCVYTLQTYPKLSTCLLPLHTSEPGYPSSLTGWAIEHQASYFPHLTEVAEVVATLPWLPVPVNGPYGNRPKMTP